MEQFEVMDEMALSNIEGGNDVLITAGSAIAGGIVGYLACSASIVAAPVAGACAYTGAKIGGAGYLIARHS
ncbi:Blp family class II bacteriocin [Streptococcus pluranimalium]|uniref:Bacteriocin n=1 Tax=Streptococcus pluranimalium TaxID=82348 RepID=A0A2L0D508_9STRE|nr:Blp family class II bacteriocin [Streptococcus pluranimalium]AUW96913.1 bacteriocin [Streptococcus pluranimalium]MDY3042523.1 Blp family class II bacteriocin [Streptococcus pluranimalium]WFM79278.1 Blp family class II bacteriocin [Streptococcus pluranimalium]HEM6117105.1 Blp family class II bacteriocin [Streptococcus suis]